MTDQLPSENDLDALSSSPLGDQSGGLFRDSRLWLLLGLACLVGLGLGFWLKAGQAPDGHSPEVGFARAMSVHHAQAVTMAQLLYDRTEDETMRVIALDIMLTQQYQIGEMTAWVSFWGPPSPENEPAMAWMGMPASERMPGMASPEEINRLRGLSGVEADGLFMQLMIPHHRSGVEMAQAILARTDQPQVRRLAEAIEVSQESEIAAMQELLQQKGFSPLPASP